MNIRLSPFVVSVFLLSFCSVSPAAFADGMPFGKARPQPILTPLDKALDDIQSNGQRAAVSVPAEKPAPVALKAEIPPAPLPRIVEVQPGTSFFGLSVGMYDPFTHGENAASLNLEWQPGVRIAGVLQPLFGAVVTTNGSLLGYGGIGVPFNITDRVFMLPSIAVGAYKKGGGVDLDSGLALRIGTELAYQFDNKSRIGLNMHVLTSGASFGRNDRTEIIGLAYTTPLDAFFKPAGGAAPAPAVQPESPPQK